MRKLVTKDLFAMARIVAKMNVKDDLRAIATNSTGQSRLDVGIDFMLTLLCGASSQAVEKDIYVFLADVLESTPQDIAESDPDVLIKRLTEDEGSKQWADFFSKLVRLMKK